MSSEAPFKFKQFEVYQSDSAMKIGTDGVLIGAWASVKNRTKILDIGSGTGLISLMLAQRNNSANITAIDIDENSVKQSQYNFKISPWADRLLCKHISFQNFSNATTEKYDLIVSNPPFFSTGIESPSKSRAMARHNYNLSFEQLLYGVDKIISDDGEFVVILPTNSFEKFSQEAVKVNLYVNKILNIFPTPNKDSVRVIASFVRIKTEITTENLIIEVNGRHNYSKEYTELTKDFYLKF